METPAASATRFASDRPTSAASGRTCPPGRRVRSTPSNPTAFAAAHAWATVSSARLSVKRTNFMALDLLPVPAGRRTVARASIRQGGDFNALQGRLPLIDIEIGQLQGEEHRRQE